MCKSCYCTDLSVKRKEDGIMCALCKTNHVCAHSKDRCSTLYRKDIKSNNEATGIKHVACKKHSYRFKQMCLSCYYKDLSFKKEAAGVICVACKKTVHTKDIWRICYWKDLSIKKQEAGTICLLCKNNPQCAHSNYRCSTSYRKDIKSKNESANVMCIAFKKDTACFK